MTLDPQCRAMLDAVAEKGSPFDVEDATEARKVMATTTRPVPQSDPRFSDVHDDTMPGPDGAMAYRYYRPTTAPATNAPCLIYYHGGGMAFGTLDSHDPICRAIAVAAHCVVISIDYRLAPEHRFPAAVEDAWAAYTEVQNRAGDFAIDAARVAVGGDSAGGNLAAVIALMARDSEIASPCFQWLIFPITDMADPNAAPAGGTIDRFAEGYLLTRAGLIWIQGLYLNGEADREDWRASPLRAADLSGLAPTLIQTAGFDPLKDEADAYAAQLNASGVTAALIDYPGMIHGFIRAIGVVDMAETAIDDAAAALTAAFAERP